MKKYFNLIATGAIFSAVVLTMFFTLNPTLIPFVLLAWFPMERAIEKIEKEA